MGGRLPASLSPDAKVTFISLQSFLDVVIELEKLDMVSSQRVDLVEACLKSIGRRDLAKKVEAYKNSGRAKAAVSSQAYLEGIENPQPQSCMKY